ncbi:hypothetical protein BJ684DRAFT_19617 [Piptocephalis cylindrospora]|uniref:BLOC-1-related complex subunit 7 n=1 Tax=Piptocephalis cylindrospora TaxID=1907219 RepID=A0A4P9Y544_9FUNG|nr:hypothetical protein BJ684DRAFT_19617 [Piptocephalis cylindrospora]|eukprot:RKP13934.1 hypothetical protein BJ684DRAFT_19617 [Piptocephalis cylindrospora]
MPLTSSFIRISNTSEAASSPSLASSMYTTAFSSSTATLNSLLSPAASPAPADPKAPVKGALKDRGKSLFDSMVALLEETTKDEDMREEFHRTAKSFVACDAQLRSMDHNMDLLAKTTPDALGQMDRLVESIASLKDLSNSLRTPHLVRPSM